MTRWRWRMAWVVMRLKVDVEGVILRRGRAQQWHWRSHHRSVVDAVPSWVQNRPSLPVHPILRWGAARSGEGGGVADFRKFRVRWAAFSDAAMEAQATSAGKGSSACQANDSSCC